MREDSRFSMIFRHTGWSLKIGRALGIDILAHWSFLIFVPVFLVYHGWSTQDWQTVLMLIVLGASVFACVILHEYGHALMARKMGVKTRDIILTPIGGLARLEGMPRTPKHEFLITIAGPLVNLVIAAIVFAYLWIRGLPFVPRELANYSQILLWMNLILFGFNLLPAFPMDGGRILRSTLAIFLGHDLATTIAAILGKMFAVAFGIWGVWKSQYGAVLGGVFVYDSAMNELAFSRYYAREGELVGEGSLEVDNQTAHSAQAPAPYDGVPRPSNPTSTDP